jgi:hypothetical protein
MITGFLRVLHFMRWSHSAYRRAFHESAGASLHVRETLVDEAARPRPAIYGRCGGVTSLAALMFHPINNDYQSIILDGNQGLW